MVLCTAVDCVSRARLLKLGPVTDLARCWKTIFKVLIVSRKACEDSAEQKEKAGLGTDAVLFTAAELETVENVATLSISAGILKTFFNSRIVALKVGDEGEEDG